MAHHQLDELDEKILKMIVENARIPFLEVARTCNVSGAAIHQRIQKLMDLGVIKGSEFIVDHSKIGYETSAYIGLFLKDLSQFNEIVNALQKIPEVIECHHITGKYDLFIKIYAKNNQHLLKIIHKKLQPLGLSRSETLISLKEAFRKQIPMDFNFNEENNFCPEEE
jgi:Lrp/AsnC family transcriptional regulator for asnA, asnC and gidA